MLTDEPRCSFCQHILMGGITGTTRTEDGGLVYICPADIDPDYELLHRLKDE